MVSQIGRHMHTCAIVYATRFIYRDVVLRFVPCHQHHVAACLGVRNMTPLVVFSELSVMYTEHWF